MYSKALIKPDGRNLTLYALHPIDEGIEAVTPKTAIQRAAPHLRWHPLRQEWVIYASHRQNRTFLPPKDYSPLAVTKNKEFPTELPEGNYDAAVFENLFPSLTLGTDLPPSMYVPTAPARGICEVVVFTKDPDTSLGKLPKEHVELILQIFAERTTKLGAHPDIHYVLPFENKGIEMGVTLHHPHGQIYSYGFIPPVQDRQLCSMREHWEKTGKALLTDIVTEEMQAKERIILESEYFLCFIPAFARYPYETWIVPKRTCGLLSGLAPVELTDLASLLKNILLRFDALWKRPFPYLMTLQQAPVKGNWPYASFYFQFTPPYRSKERLKYLAGTELGAGVFVNDALPEEKAKELREITSETKA